MCLSLLDAELPSVLSRVKALKCWLQPERCNRGGNTSWWLLQVPGALRILLSLERGTWDACPHIHALVSICPGGCPASPSQFGLSSAQPSYAVITPPDGTADILLEIPNNSLLTPIFQALI